MWGGVDGFPMSGVMVNTFCTDCCGSVRKDHSISHSH